MLEAIAAELTTNKQAQNMRTQIKAASKRHVGKRDASQGKAMYTPTVNSQLGLEPTVGKRVRCQLYVSI